MSNEFSKIERVYKSKLPFVVFRKPNEAEISVIVQNTTELFQLNSYSEQGFVFAPFDKTEQKIIFLLHNSEKFTINSQDFEVSQATSAIVRNETTSALKKAKQQHISLVEIVLNEIQQKSAEKIVVSRKETLKVSNFDVLNSYKKMLDNYKNEMVYLWFHPKVGFWMGASPEKLVDLNQQKFKTMALAGTQLYQNTTNVVWNDKEKKEQQFVTDYILETIKSTISAVKVTKPYTVKAGNLVHIRTDIFGELVTKNSLGKLIEALHPTPAVCGLPKKTATDFILQNEGYHRAFYSGFLGELNINNTTNLFVNLRCMQIVNNEISIYVGGGITANSNPEKEWNETVYKAEVMKKIV